MMRTGCRQPDRMCTGLDLLIVFTTSCSTCEGFQRILSGFVWLPPQLRSPFSFFNPKCTPEWNFKHAFFSSKANIPTLGNNVFSLQCFILPVKILVNLKLSNQRTFTSTTHWYNALHTNFHVYLHVFLARLVCHKNDMMWSVLVCETVSSESTD